MPGKLFLHQKLRYCHFMRLVLAFSLFFTSALAAAAAETPWQEVAPGVSMRLVTTGVVKPNGMALIGLEFDMPENTKTYWRVPGDTGIPTQLDFTGSTGIEDAAIRWPYPLRDVATDYLDYVYYGPTLLPIALKAEGDAPQIELSVIAGVCSDICIPAQARFSLPLDRDDPDRPNGLRIRQAEALAPIPWDGSDAAIGAVSYRAADRMLAVTIIDPSIDIASLIAATEDGEPAFGAPQKSPEQNLVLIPLLGKDDEIRLEAPSVQLTFMTDMGAYEVTRPITAGGTE